MASLFRSPLIVPSLCCAFVVGVVLYLGAFHADAFANPNMAKSQGALFAAATGAIVASLGLCRFWIVLRRDDVDNIFKSSTVAPRDWFEENVKYFQMTRANYLSGLCVGAVAAVTYAMIGYIETDSPMVEAVCYLAIFAAAFSAGMALLTVAQSARFLHRMGNRFDLHLAAHPFGVLSLGQTLFKCYAVVVGTALLYEATAVLAFGDAIFGQSKLSSFNSAEFSNLLLSPPLLFLGLPCAVFLFGSFLYAQWPLHRKLVAAKKARVREIEARIREIGLPGDKDDGTVANLEYLHSELERTLAVPNWPCHPKHIWGGSALSISSLAITPAMQAIASFVVDTGNPVT